MYEITVLGRSIHPHLKSLCDWGATHKKEMFYASSRRGGRAIIIRTLGLCFGLGRPTLILVKENGQHRLCLIGLYKKGTAKWEARAGYGSGYSLRSSKNQTIIAVINVVGVIYLSPARRDYS